MRIARKLVLTAAGFLMVGTVGLSTPAAAVDSSWGCGGLCASGPGAGR